MKFTLNCNIRSITNKLAKSNPNIPTVNIISEDPVTKLILEAECDAEIPTVAGLFAPACEVFRLDDGVVYENSGTTASPVWTAFGTIAALADGKIFVGNASAVATAVDVSGDVTISNLGAVTIGAKKVTAAKMALTDAHILVGTSGGAGGDVAMSGDVTIANTGATTIGANKITAAKLAVAITPSHVVKFAGVSSAENDSDASVVITVAGVLATDVVTASILAQAGTASILKVVPTTDTITVTLSGNGGAGTQISYSVLRAIA